jgi:dTDP-glucose 4,6-dehydratase
VNLLIIGGTGFFGKSILHFFLGNKSKKHKIDSICVLSRNTDKFLRMYPEFKNEKIQYIKGDITTIDFLPEADIVIHAATSTSQKDYKINPKREKRNIEFGVSNYIKLAKQYHKNSRIVYCSSGAVYGKQPIKVKKMSEEFPFQDVLGLPVEKREYALGKRYAEEQIKQLGSHGLNVSIARCFAFYGEYLPEDQHYAYGNFIGAAKKGENIVVNAKHNVIRSYMHADDLVCSLINIALKANPNCPVYNVGSDQGISIFDLADEIANEYNVKVIRSKNIDLKNIDRYVPNTNRLKQLCK